jgi:hypothetical protein
VKVHLFESLFRLISKRHVTFKGVQRHAGHEWNTKADALAVKGCDKQAQEIHIKLAMKVQVSGELRFFAIDRFHLEYSDNLRNILDEI